MPHTTMHSPLQCSAATLGTRTDRNFYRRLTRCRFRLQGPESGFMWASRMAAPQRPPKRAQGGLLQAANARLVRPAMYLLALVNFANRRCHAEFFYLQEPQRSTTSLHNSPQTRTAFSSTHRAITVISPPASLFQVSSNPPRLATASSKPLHRRSDHQLFSANPPPSLALSRIA